MEYSVEDLLIKRGEGEETSAGVTIKARAGQLGGDFSIMEAFVGPRELLAPHTHDHEDQAVYVIEGELEFEVGGEDGDRFTAPTGSYVIKPRGIQHSFWNATDEPVRYIELSGGKGFQGFVDASTELGAVEASRQSEEQYGLTWGYDRIPKMMLQHRLTSISGVEMSWEKLQDFSPKDMLATIQEKLEGIVG